MTASRPLRRDAARNREAILSAAIAVLAAEPGATMREIADASGTGRTTLYRHFPDREALVAAIYDRVHVEADAAVDDALRRAGSADPVRILADMAAELASFGDRYSFLQHHDGARPRDAGRSRSEARARLLEFIHDAQRSGGVRDDLHADWMIDALRAIITQAARRHDDAPADRTRMVRRTISSLLASPPDRAAEFP